MGTNYYAKIDNEKCEHCGRGGDAIHLHIGKNSCGWRFVAQIHEEHYKTWEEFQIFIGRSDVALYTEYKEAVSVLELLRLIDLKQNEKQHDYGNEFGKSYTSGPMDFQEGEFS